MKAVFQLKKMKKMKNNYYNNLTNKMKNKYKNKNQNKNQNKNKINNNKLIMKIQEKTNIINKTTNLNFREIKEDSLKKNL